MKRRDFLSRSAKTLAVTSVLQGFAEILHAQQPGSSSTRITYRNAASGSTDQERIGQYSYFLWADPALLSLRKSEEELKAIHADLSDEQKRIQLEVNTWREAKNSGEAVVLSGQYEFSVKEIEYFQEKIGELEHTFCRFRMSPLKAVKGEDLWKEEFPEEFILEHRLGYVAEMFKMKRKGADDAFLEVYKDVNLNPFGCFLTTACTEARGLADDCYELETLRSFRDNFMLKDSVMAGKVKEYYRIAPTIVDRINASASRLALHEAMYDELVLPAVRMIEAGELEAAEAHYSSCVARLIELLPE